MPFREHLDIKPLNDDEAIWRYMDLAKFVSLVSSGTLHFSGADQFSDPWEGVPPQSVLDRFEQRFAGRKHFDPASFRKFFRNEIIPRRVVSCWHVSDWESAAMWSLYGARGAAVAIRSDIGRLKRSLAAEPEDVLIGKVVYSDHRDFQLPTDSVDGPADKFTFAFFFKRNSFAFENELRALIGRSRRLPEFEGDGYAAKVDVRALIDSVYIAPTAKEWFAEAVRSILTEYGLSTVQAKRSSMDDKRLL